MNYWELRKLISQIIPRRTQLFSSKDRVNAVKEKGRKTNYHQFNVEKKEWLKHERLLNTEEVNSFLEISVRAAACPMPLNLDVWDGLLCPFACRYCVTGDTIIDTPNGRTFIKDLKVGDQVITLNEDTKETEIDIIEDTMNREDEIYLIEIGEKTLQITSEHPVYTRRGWIKVSELKNDDEVLCLEE